MNIDIAAQIAFLEDIRDAATEREAAFAERAVDGERWRAAKQAYGEKRSFWRQIAALVKAQAEVEMTALDTVTPGTVKGGSEVLNPAEEN